MVAAKRTVLDKLESGLIGRVPSRVNRQLGRQIERLRHNPCHKHILPCLSVYIFLNKMVGGHRIELWTSCL